MTTVSRNPNPDAIWTVPNALSVIRLAGIPVFFWLLLGPGEYVWAFVLLVVAGVSDYLDGYIARRWNQVSRLGTVLDPLVDRLYIAATIIGLALVGIIPWLIVSLLIARELLLLLLVPFLRGIGRTVLPVIYIGKAATFALLWGFPLLLLSTQDGWVGFVAFACGWAFSLWGVVLYWYAGILYALETRDLIQRHRARAV